MILSVPCCQHEMNEQIQNEILPALKYGLIKERMAALFTDALRAEYLEREGYDTQNSEFIDMEHTPKNILIRAVRTGESTRKWRGNKAAGRFSSCNTDAGETAWIAGWMQGENEMIRRGS